ncbi:helix-turn-helix transcriptional regulator [Streptococcus pluranimalium]|uniref:helix-turn-helix transcriptional regulator n=1 Tax=Streptococcus pluranimalium TaxID=82348 RepID=UPI003F68C1BE
MTDITFKDNRLRELRTNYPEKLTQEKLAKIIGVTKRTIIAWEKNERDITPDKAKKLANHFGVDVAYLLGYQEKPYIELDEFIDNINPVGVEPSEDGSISLSKDDIIRADIFKRLKSLGTDDLKTINEIAERFQKSR